MKKDLRNRNRYNLGNCYADDNEIQDLIYRRDLIWITINVINYLTQDCLLEEAQQILELIQGCNGICFHEIPPMGMKIINEGKGTVYNVGCGCGH